MQLDMAGTTVRVLWPVTDTRDANADSLNNNSLVLEVEVGGHRLLLTGDIERATETALVDGHHVRPLSGVLKVPHHGSRTSSSEAFLRATRPALAVVSARTGHGRLLPHPEIARRYRELGIALWRTQDGAVTLAMKPAGWCAKQGARQFCLPSSM
jgi:competence protein ComEC